MVGLLGRRERPVTISFRPNENILPSAQGHPRLLQRESTPMVGSTSSKRRSATTAAVRPSVVAGLASGQTSSKVHKKGTNQLLSLLSPAERERILARCELLPLKIEHVLYDVGD